jgi:polysaccharide biosynthesis transport protein
MNLSQLFNAIRGRWVLCLGVFLAIVGGTLLVSLLLPKQYVATGSIVIDTRRSDPVSGNAGSGQTTSYLATELDILGSRSVALKVVDLLKLDQVPRIIERYREDTSDRGDIKDWIAQNVLLENLRLQPTRDSGVVRIQYTSTNPEMAANVANAFAQAYMGRTLELRVEPARQTSMWFDDQLKNTLKSDLEKTVARLTEFQQKHGITATDERVDVENSRLLELSGQLVTAQSQTFEQQARERQLETGGRGQGNVPDVLASPVVQRLKADLSVAEARLTDLSSRLGVNHPEYQNVQAQVRALRSKMDAETSAIANSMRSASSASQQREGALREAVSQQKARVLALKQQNNELAVLSRDVESAQRAYDTAMQRVSQTRLEAQINQTNVAIVNPAVAPIDPSRPRILLNVALAIVLGACLAPGIAILREAADRRLRSISDLEDLYALPVLCDLPSHRRGLRWPGSARQKRLPYGPLPPPQLGGQAGAA